MKRIKWSVAMLCLMLLINPFMTAAEDTPGTGIVDTEAPVIRNLKPDKTVVQAPGSVDFSADITDDISGVLQALLELKLGDEQSTFKRVRFTQTYMNEYGEPVPYEDGKWHASIGFDEYAAPGDYTISMLSTEDNAGNWQTYSRSPFSNDIPEEFRNITITVLGSTPDTTPPVINSVRPEQSEVQAPGEISFTADITDDLSGVAELDCTFYNKAQDVYTRNITFRDYYIDETNNVRKYEDGLWHATYKPDIYAAPGVYVLDLITFRDNAGNGTGIQFEYDDDIDDGAAYIYHTDDPSEQTERAPEGLQNCFFTILEGTPDTAAPVINGLTLSKNVIQVPDEIELTMDVSDDLSGVKQFFLTFYNETYRSNVSPANWYLEDDQWHAILPLNSYTRPGEYRVSYASVEDYAGNFAAFFDYHHDDPYAIPKSIQDTWFVVENAGISADLTAANDEKLADKIKETGNEAFILVDCSLNTVVSADVFETLRGTDRVLTLENDGIQWIFRGQDIVEEAKDVDVSVHIERVSDITDEERKNALILQEEVGKNPALVLLFAENGVLPGKAKVRIKTDYVLKKYLGEDAITLYYYRSTENDLDEIEDDLRVKHDDYIEFDIDHCSEYLLVGEDRSLRDNILRIAGSTRYQTSVLIAETFRDQLGVTKFDSVILASGENFADALSGSYLAYKLNAPILITKQTQASYINSYISSSLKAGGTVYVLGGEGAVPSSCLSGLEGFRVERISGKNRYLTSVEILKKAGVTDGEILISTGKNFADSLSASAAKRPILLVNETLSPEQTLFLNSLKNPHFYVLGGEGAVPSSLETELKQYGSVDRIAGKTRYETSVKIAETFFSHPPIVFMAYAKNFPDGLCGGSLAGKLDSPIILISKGNEAAAASYCAQTGIYHGMVLGGEAVIDNLTANGIIPMPAGR